LTVRPKTRDVQEGASGDFVAPGEVGVYEVEQDAGACFLALNLRDMVKKPEYSPRVAVGISEIIDQQQEDDEAPAVGVVWQIEHAIALENFIANDAVGHRTSTKVKREAGIP
jgi:hypothetical protein